MVVVWRTLLVITSRLGLAGRLVFVDARAATLLAALAPAVVFAIRSQWDEAAAAAGLWVLGVLLLAGWAARDRFIIGEFKGSAVDPAAPGGSAVPPVDLANLVLERGAGGVGGVGGLQAVGPPVDLANLLLVEISRLGDLFRVVGDRRAVSSGLAHQSGLDATLSVDDLVENLQGTISAEAKATVGPVTIPLAPLVTLFGKLLQAPRLTGTLHRDGHVLILTAQTARGGGLSWRVEAAAAPGEQAPEVVSRMVEELALRIYTDLALGRAVRWQASESFVEGLRCFRACLRTPKDRKFNLKRAEELFLTALAEDEDFPLAYYNLGVVYSELRGLAVAAGREEEAKTRLDAAETSFGRAIEKDPARWECYFAFAQTQFRHARHDSVIDLCSHILQLDPGWADEAKARELWARALLERGRQEDYREAVNHARRASQLALRSMARARLIGRPSPRGEDDPGSRCAELATGCLLTFSDIYSRQMPVCEGVSGRGGRFSQSDRIRRRVQSLAQLAPLTQGKAELRFDFGQRALAGGHLELAEEELAAAVRSDPTRPSYSAGLALARATRLSDEGREISARERDAIIERCQRALQGMAGAFFPSRDARACNILAKVYDRMGSAAHGDHETAEQLRAIAGELGGRLEGSVGGASVSGIFLEVLQATDTPLSSQVGAYGEAAQQAGAHLVKGQEQSERGNRTKALIEFREALRCAERATSLNPLSTLAWETLGDVHRELRDFQNARIAWRQALGTDPDNPRLYDKIGSSYWHIAFQGPTRALRGDLEQAAKYFEGALLLYGSGKFEEHVLTHYRLGKLSATLRKFGEARRHLEIVEAVYPVDSPPVVGWQLLGFAHLQERSFSECEYYFGRVVQEGKRLDLPADDIIGDRLDEQRWPLGLVRAWGHLGLAITFAERDGDLAKAETQVEAAEALLGQLELDPQDPANDERFPTRAPAAVVECRGLILLRDGKVEDAIGVLENAVREFPHSRAYLELALALEQRALGDVTSRKEIVPRAQRLLAHAVSLRPTDEPSAEIEGARERLARLNGADAEPVT